MAKLNKNNNGNAIIVGMIAVAIMAVTAVTLINGSVSSLKFKTWVQSYTE